MDRDTLLKAVVEVNDIGITKVTWEDGELTVYFDNDPTPWGAQEFISNSYTQGVLDTITTLLEALEDEV